MSRYLVDTNVFVYARGGDHPYRVPCRSVLRAAAAGIVDLEASVELVQEFAHLLLRRSIDREDALEEVDDVRSQCRLHPFDHDVLQTSLGLLRRHPGLGVRDAVHAGTALRAGITQILGADRVFDSIHELRRVDPAHAGAPWLAAGT